ncbi:neuronal acetylcholine receptor subunit alpha-10-like isoform X1 [Saccostrea echinata]|uniref:neuronal acetylcholine receptor subunit alpha-10-like isoform X1 n=1 Tax=Saccostrea echinata TaxID=191078 RepID=UPI002A7F120E|nr:neuronal acetylcholine receptor subunit alpha-10-like isoform X1 [Saccostrea echinata]
MDWLLLVIHLTTILTWQNCHAGDVVQMSTEKLLIKKLLTEYKERGIMGRPVERHHEILTVKFGLSLIQILDLDERNQVLTTNVWVTYQWKDIYMTWNQSEYDNITKIRVPKGSIWEPDIKLYNYADERMEERRDANMVIESDGTVLWIPQAIFKSVCKIDIMYFPFDMQTCKLKFSTWSYDGGQIDLKELYGVETGFELSDYVESNEWNVLGSGVDRNVITYACCPDAPYVDITFNIRIKRKPAFYNYILILPCILLSSLTLVLFWLPPESPAKMQLGMNIFVAFFVLLLLLNESTPPASASIPLIGAYYCLNMIMITLSTFLSVVIVNLYFRGSKSRVPRPIKTIMVDYIARIMCMHEQVKTKKKSGQESNGIVRGGNRRDKNGKYDKVGYYEMQAENSWKEQPNGLLNNEHANFCEQDKTEMSTSLSGHFDTMSSDVKEIKTYLKKMIDKITDKDAKEVIAREWRIVALVLDRLFFFLYFFAIVISVCAVFKNAFFDTTDYSNLKHNH